MGREGGRGEREGSDVDEDNKPVVLDGVGFEGSRILTASD